MCYLSEKATVLLFFSPLRESLSIFTSESLRKNINQRRHFSKKYLYRDVRTSPITGFPHDTFVAGAEDDPISMQCLLCGSTHLTKQILDRYPQSHFLERIIPRMGKEHALYREKNMQHGVKCGEIKFCENQPFYPLNHLALVFKGKR